MLNQQYLYLAKVKSNFMKAAQQAPGGGGGGGGGGQSGGMTISLNDIPTQAVKALTDLLTAGGQSAGRLGQTLEAISLMLFGGPQHQKTLQNLVNNLSSQGSIVSPLTDWAKEHWLAALLSALGLAYYLWNKKKSD